MRKMEREDVDITWQNGPMTGPVIEIGVPVLVLLPVDYRVIQNK